MVRSSTTRVVRFALTPAQAITGVIDMTTSEGRKIFEHGTRALSKDGFDCEADGLFGFVESLKARASTEGWAATGGILQIPQSTDPDVNDSLMQHYGSIQLKDIRAHSQTYVGTSTRNAQNSLMMAIAIRESLTAEGRNKIDLRSDEFTNNVEIGPLLFKIVVEESHVDTHATTMSIRRKLSALDDYLKSIGHNVTKLNLHAKLLLRQLAARKETTHDLVANLFKAYATSSDPAFREYMKKKMDTYEDGHHMTADDIMKYATNKFESMQDNQTWNAPTNEQAEMMVLRTEIGNLKLAIKGKHKTGNPQRRRDDSRDDDQTEWKRNPIWEKPDNVHEVREIYKKKFHFCCKATGGKCEGKWRRHNPKDCEGKAYNYQKPLADKNTAADRTPKGGRDNKAKRIKFDKALANNVEMEISSEGDSD